MARTLAGLFYFTVALGWYVAMANAYQISIVGPSSAMPSDAIEVDVVLDTEDAMLYGFLVQIYFDPTVLWSVDGIPHPLPGSDYNSLYLYPDNWYVHDIVFAGIVAPGVNQSVATLIFHVMDVASTQTDITIDLIALAGTDALDFAGVTTLVPLSIHVGPSPVRKSTSSRGAISTPSIHLREE